MKNAHCKVWNVLLVLPLIVGCGGGPSGPVYKTVPASGTVKEKEGDKPVAGALVQFIPLDAKTGGGAVGMTDAEGKFELVTGSGDKAKKGVTPGKYKVTISLMVKPDGSPIPPDPTKPPAMVAGIEALSQQFSNPGMSKLVAEVGEQGGNSYDYKVTRAKPMK